MKIRVVKTASKAQAVQVVRYQNNKRIVLHTIIPVIKDFIERNRVKIEFTVRVARLRVRLARFFLLDST